MTIQETEYVKGLIKEANRMVAKARRCFDEDRYGCSGNYSELEKFIKSKEMVDELNFKMSVLFRWMKEAGHDLSKLQKDLEWEWLESKSR